MPNWCEGVLKIRGTKPNILRFFKEGLAPATRFQQGEEPEIQIQEDEWGNVYVSLKDRIFWVKETRRHFIDTHCFEVYFDEDDETVEQVVVIEEFKAAWGMDATDLAKLSKIFQLDFKVYGFECGMAFNQSIEIHKGEIIKDETITFKDYEWECVCPRIGG